MLSQVQALYALQALVHRLEHPNKLLHSIFDVLYEVELISEVGKTAPMARSE